MDGNIHCWFVQYLEPDCWIPPVETWPGCQLSWRTGKTLTCFNVGIFCWSSFISSYYIWGDLWQIIWHFAIVIIVPHGNHISFPFSRTDVVFTGYDIVPGNVEGHQKKFNAKPWKFEVRNFSFCLRATLQLAVIKKKSWAFPPGARHSRRSCWEIWHHPVPTHSSGCKF